MGKAPRVAALLLGMGMMASTLRAEPGVVAPQTITSLAVEWAFRPGDDPGWADPELDASTWRRIRIPTGFGRDDVTSSMAWYRLELDLAPRDQVLPAEERADLRLGLTLGKVDSAYEIYAGGLLLGGVGALPPTPKMDYDRHALYPIPSAAISTDGRLVLALRVWKAPVTRSTVGGPHEGPFLLGPIEQLTRRELLSELPSLFLAGWFMVFGLLHLALYRRRPSLRIYLWFALFCSSFGVYAFLRTQWRYFLGDHFLLFKELEHIDLYVGLFLFVQVVWPLFGLRIGPWLRGVQGAAVVAGGVVALPGLRPNLELLVFWQLTLFAVVCAFVVMVFRQLWHGHPEARIMVLGSVVVAVGFAHEVGVDRGYYLGPRLGDLCFTFFVSCLALSLASQFTRVHAEIEALRSSEQAAERANRAKTEFLANMSHEIRTPMTGILGAVDLILADDLSETSREHARIIRSSTRSLLGIIDGILDFSRVESGRLELERASFPLRENLEGVLELLEPSARAREIGLRLEMAEDLPEWVVGDPLRLRQVLLNLLGNGIKFTSRGQVVLVVETFADTDSGPGQGDGWWLRFRVEDSGIGMAPEVCERLFRPFTQADSSTTRRFGGTGLGLAISQRLVELMGGRIEVESQLGVGSTFTFEIGFGAVEPNSNAEPVVPPPSLPRGHRSGHRILLAEDNPVNQLVVSRQLEILGIEVLVASNGLEVLEILEREKIALVLMDCQMPELDGYQTTQKIREGEGEANGRHLTVVALTASALVGDRERCLAAGMDDYLPKPFTEAELEEVLERWLGDGRGEEREGPFEFAVE